MNILYAGGYRKRFKKVVVSMTSYKPSSVLELCFGDLFIAEYCAKNNINWIGVDMNNYFVSLGKKKNYNVYNADISALAELPTSEMCVIIGSLYHFKNEINILLTKMLQSTATIIVSEPIKNMTNSNNLFGWIARKSANTGKGDVSFRYTESTFLEMLKCESMKLNFSYTIVDYYKKDIIISIKKNGKS